jgi:general secretion pathway protein G
MSMKRPVPRRRRGFTLIEVMLVLVILVLLAALSVPLYSQYQRQANRNAARSQIGAMKTPLSAYQLNLGYFPSTQQGLEALLSPPADLANPAKWEGPYLDGNYIPVDPWDQPYQYQYPGTNNPQTYDLWSLGPDGQSGTEDDITNWDT